MAEIVESIEISRRPEEVFSYATDFSRFPEWQGSVVSAHREAHASLAVGSRAVVTRQVGRRQLAGTEQITELHPPNAWAVRGIGGLIVTTAKATIEPLDRGQRSRVTITLAFEGRGIGRLLVPLAVRRQARRQLPQNEQRLKEVLERGA
ncbi:MAG TPA: SRPBCC family protein [Gemmatimonadales bacterium]|nr:SRPBCC family protein [Gemmatimonadales bacterium]